MIKADEDFINSALHGYYNSETFRVPTLGSCHMREFGYQQISSGWQRHMSFKSEDGLKGFLQVRSPASVYCSASMYERPASTPMSEKGWMGADLIFDIDAKDLNLDCRPGHVVYVSGKKVVLTGNGYDGNDNDTDNGNGNGNGDNYIPTDPSYTRASNPKKSVSVSSLPCNKCMGAAHEQAKMISEILEKNFGISRDFVDVYFSGNEGYHIHVTDPELYRIPKEKRIKITKHMIKNGITVDSNVTTDITRIFRMPGTVNAKSGLAKIKVRGAPFADAVVFDSKTVNVIANCPIPFELGRKKFGPYHDSEYVSVPEYAAVYMILKGLATITVS